MSTRGDTAHSSEEEDNSGSSYETDSDGRSSEGSEDEEVGQSTLEEKLSLLSLAAEHDRVDILQAVLKPASFRGNSSGETAVMSLLLNNRGEGEKVAVFIPPLHRAVACGSVNATTCLLRMGADPSIRPVVPRGYTPCDSSRSSQDRNKSVTNKYRSKADCGNWRKFDGMTAWELAFGASAPLVHADNDKTESESSDDEEAVHQKKTWFWNFKQNLPKEVKSKSPTRKLSDSTEKRRKKSALNIPPSKLEGIKHAFTAEALRAIASNEVGRLEELLNSGMDKGDTCGDTGYLEIGGKDLLGWCYEMNALECAALLKEREGLTLAKETPGEPPLNGETALQQVVSPDDFTSSKNGMNIAGTPTIEAVEASVVINDTPIPTTDEEVSCSTAPLLTTPVSSDQITLLSTLRIKQEESESLSLALSKILDNLAEEVSITQGLLFHNGSNSALVSHVRALKSLRASREDDIDEWKVKLRNREKELDMVLGWWDEIYPEEEIYFDFDDSLVLALTSSPSVSNSQAMLDDETNYSIQKEETIKRNVAEMTAQLAASEAKVRKLRASIVGMAEENTSNLATVEKLGLSGAVKLARSLRDEVREREFALGNVKSLDALCRAKIMLVRSCLEERKSAKQLKQDDKSGCGGGSTLPIARYVSNDVNIGEGSMEGGDKGDFNVTDDRIAARDIAVWESENETHGIPKPDTAADAAAEEYLELDGTLLAGNNDGYELNEAREVENEEFDQKADRFDCERSATCSDDIAQGRSHEIMARPLDGKGFMSVDVWDLILRIVGLGRAAVKRTAASVLRTGSDGGTGPMIV